MSRKKQMVYRVAATLSVVLQHRFFGLTVYGMAFLVLLSYRQVGAFVVPPPCGASPVTGIWGPIDLYFGGT